MEMNERIHNAVRDNDLSLVENFLKDDARLCEIEEEDGEQPLHTAAKNGLEEMTKVLLRCGANLSAEDHYGMLAIHHAAFEGKTHVLKYLLEMGSNKNAQDNSKRTPLMLAAEHGHLEIVRFLIGQEADALLRAREVATIRPAPLPMTFTDDGPGAVHVAAQYGHVNVVKELLSLMHVDTPGRYGRSALNEAAENGHVDVAKLLITAGANVNYQADEEQAPPMADAAANGHAEMVELLLKNWADPRLKAKYSKSPLENARLFRKSAVIEVFKRFGITE